MIASLLGDILLTNIARIRTGATILGIIYDAMAKRSAYDTTPPYVSNGTSRSEDYTNTICSRHDDMIRRRFKIVCRLSLSRKHIATDA